MENIFINENVHANSLVALRDLEGLPDVSNLLPYFLVDLLSESLILKLDDE